MDSGKIKLLLEKYWEGESSLSEEAQLRSYFKGNNIADELKPYQPLFQFFHQEHEKHLSEDFEEKLIQNIHSTDTPTAKIRRLPYYLLRIAAVGLLLLAVYFVAEQNFIEKEDPIATYDSELSPEEAYAQTKAALLLVSAKLNKGTQVANEGMVQVRKATDVIK